MVSGVFAWSYSSNLLGYSEKGDLGHGGHLILFSFADIPRRLFASLLPTRKLSRLPRRMYRPAATLDASVQLSLGDDVSSSCQAKRQARGASKTRQIEVV